MISLRKSLMLAGVAVLIGTPVLAEKMGHGPGHRGPMGAGLFEMADANKDGKVTKAEADKASAARFAKISGGKSTISESQFIAFQPKGPEGKGPRGKDRDDRKEDAFKRIDWNNDGVLSLEEFSTVPHARFIRADRDGSGAVNCSPKRRMGEDKKAMPSSQPPGDEAGARPSDGIGHHRHGMRGGRGMMGRHDACVGADADKSGTMTRAELDSDLAAKFSAATKGATSMTPAQFATVKEDRRADMRKGMFKMLDKNGDGRLSAEEFSGPQTHMFAMLDKNKDGVIEKSELPRHGFQHRMKPDAK